MDSQVCGKIMPIHFDDGKPDEEINGILMRWYYSPSRVNTTGSGGRRTNKCGYFNPVSP